MVGAMQDDQLVCVEVWVVNKVVTECVVVREERGEI